MAHLALMGPTSGSVSRFLLLFGQASALVCIKFQNLISFSVSTERPAICEGICRDLRGEIAETKSFVRDVSAIHA
jgi:hypothetical protein